MALSAVGEAVLISREGRRLKAYRDSQGVWTIGVGVTSASGLIKVTPGLTITAAECDALAHRAFRQYEAYVDRALHGTIVPQNAYDALVSVCYNIGPGAFAKSTFLRKIKAGDMAGAKASLLLWGKPASIIPRRQAEADQFATPYAERMPERIRGAGLIRATAATGSAVSPAPRGPASVIAPKPTGPTITLPAWWMVIAGVVDALFAPGQRRSAH